MDPAVRQAMDRARCDAQPAAARTRALRTCRPVPAGPDPRRRLHRARRQDASRHRRPRRPAASTRRTRHGPPRSPPSRCRPSRSTRYPPSRPSGTGCTSRPTAAICRVGEQRPRRTDSPATVAAPRRCQRRRQDPEIVPVVQQPAGDRGGLHHHRDRAAQRHERPRPGRRRRPADSSTSPARWAPSRSATRPACLDGPRPARTDSRRPARNLDEPWQRHHQRDGGRVLDGRASSGSSEAFTGYIDRHFSVMAQMGERLLLHRLRWASLKSTVERALGTVGLEQQMRLPNSLPPPEACSRPPATSHATSPTSNATSSSPSRSSSRVAAPACSGTGRASRLSSTRSPTRPRSPAADARARHGLHRRPWSEAWPATLAVALQCVPTFALARCSLCTAATSRCRRPDLAEKLHGPPTRSGTPSKTSTRAA